MEFTDRRKHYRLRIRMKIRLDGLDVNSQPFSEDTETVNVSLEGVSFLTKEALAIGQLVTISVSNKCRVQARVAWVGEAQRDGWREVGAGLIPPIVDWVIRQAHFF